MSISLAAILLAQAAAGEAPATPPPAPPKCDSEAHAAFDFWVGEWDVYPNGRDNQVARSTIERLYNGCAVRENWMPLRGGPGGSLNNLDPATGQWHQTWIGSAPGRAEFVGGPAGEGRMVLTGFWAGSGPGGADGLTRMTYSRQEDGSVRQHGEFSADHGLTWQTSFDLIYRKRAEEAE